MEMSERIINSIQTRLDSLTLETYGDIQKAIGRERNKILGTCLLALADVPREIPDFHS